MSKSNKSLVVIPTYNERANLLSLVPEVLRQSKDLDILVVDDNSPDGTGEAAKALARKFKGRVWLLNRPGKMGLGSAYVEGLQWGLKKDYRLLLQMDADGSHDPGYIPQFLDFARTHDVVTGSRYLDGKVSVANWPLSRLFLSKAANRYARLATGLPLTDCTSGFKCFRSEVLRSIGLSEIKSDGYSFQIEVSLKAFRKGFRFKELPILFVDRHSGQSKMTPRIVREAVWRVWAMRWSK